MPTWGVRSTAAPLQTNAFSTHTRSGFRITWAATCRSCEGCIYETSFDSQFQEVDPIANPPHDPVVIDAHTHLFPVEVVQDRARFLARDPWFKETFGHPKAIAARPEEMIASMESAGITRSVVCGWPWRDMALCRMHNDELAAIGAAHPDRISWLGIVNPARPGAAAAVARCAELGAVGIGELNADGQDFAWDRPRELADFAEACIALDLPILMHTSEPIGHLYPGKGTATVARLLPFLEAFPALRVVMAHWGGGLPFYELMPEVARVTQNVVYDSAASTYLYRFGIFPVVERLVGQRRILFGSDYPVLKQAAFLKKTLASGLPDHAIPDILAANAIRTFRLPGYEHEGFEGATP